ncbi:ThiF family adenylyltransferase [Blastomonas sp.]|uniref:HesA/MoeB/ThiF family protein n=1 Tax=Blastomonas sp. TaxID=1909299 RepID=UPI0035946127
MPLTPDQLDRHARHIVLPEIGGVGVARLARAHVLLVGMGGIGCPALQYLAGAGIGTLTLIDDDTVDLSNLQRQTLFTPADIGQPKATVAARRVQAFDPALAVTAISERIVPANAAALLAGADVIIDGTDNFATRLLVSDTATALRIPLVSAALGRFQGQVGTFRGWLPDQPCYRCFVGDAFDAEDCDTCAEQGVLGAMVGMVGSFAAMEAVRAITGFGDDPAGKLHLIDGLKPMWRTLKITKDAGCRACGASATPA